MHDREGNLVPGSQRHWDGDAHAPVAADPDRVRVPRVARRLSGTWMYGGHWSTHFGHFLLETLPNLWPTTARTEALAGIVFHRPVRGKLPPGSAHAPLERPELTGWQGELLDLAGYGAADVRVVHGRGVRVQRLIVPPRPVLLKRWAQAPAVDLWRRISEAVGHRGQHSRVYLSRSRFHATETGAARARVDLDWQAHLDASFASAGFEVVHPETLSIVDQITVVRGADVLAGLAGSAMHLSAFAEPGTHVLVVGDRRSPRRPNDTQTMLDAACGHLTAFVPSDDRATLDSVLEGIDSVADEQGRPGVRNPE